MNNPTLFQRQRRNPKEVENPSRIPVGATVKSFGRGWVVVEESTDEEDDGNLVEDPKEQRKQLRLRVSSMVQRMIGVSNNSLAYLLNSPKSGYY